MPPEDEVRSWMLVYYTEDRKLTPDKYWKDYCREQYKAFKGSTKVNGDVRKTADEITSGATNEEDKLRRLFEYCRTKIKNTQRDVITAEERADTKQNKTPADTISQGAGSGFDIDMAFAALASAAGFDARIARVWRPQRFILRSVPGQCPFLARLQCRRQHGRQVAFLRSR